MKEFDKLNVIIFLFIILQKNTKAITKLKYLTECKINCFVKPLQNPMQYLTSIKALEEI